MAAAVIIAVLIMLAARGRSPGSSSAIRRSRCWRSSFLLLIGMTLVADGVGFHVPKGYIYAAIGFSVAVEALNQLPPAAAVRSPMRKSNADPASSRSALDPNTRPSPRQCGAGGCSAAPTPLPTVLQGEGPPELG